MQTSLQNFRIFCIVFLNLSLVVGRRLDYGVCFLCAEQSLDLTGDVFPRQKMHHSIYKVLKLYSLTNQMPPKLTTSSVEGSRIRKNEENPIRSRIKPSDQKRPTEASRVLDNKENVNADGLQEMISLLKEYEHLCISKQDFTLAEEAKNKIELLRGQSILLRKEQLDAQEKLAVSAICQEGQEQIRKFQQFWDTEVQSMIQNLKEIQDSLLLEQQEQLAAFRNKLQTEPVPKVKHSPKTLQLRNHLSSLIKARKYKEAENTKNKLRQIQEEEDSRWVEKCGQKKLLRVDQLQKRHQSELQALRVRLEGAFNQKIKERDRKFQILLKKNRKRRIESSKVSRERVRSKNGVLTESICYLNQSRT